MSIEIESNPAVLFMTLEITRAATGKTEIVELIGTPIPQEKDAENGSDSLDRLS